MRIAWTIATIGVGAIVASCSLLTTFDGYVAGAGAADASADARADASGVDDAASTTDATQSDGASVRWCLTQTAHRFCDDFDGPDMGFKNWTDVKQLNGATAALDTAAYTSAPRSLVTATHGGQSSSPAYLELTSTTIVKHVAFAFDYRIDTRDSVTGYAEAAYIRFDNGTDFYFRVRADPAANGYTAESAQDGGMPVQHNATLPSSISFDTWHRVTIDIELATKPAVNVTVDAIVVVSQMLEPDLYAPGVVTVSPGYGYNGSPSGPWQMRFDNVTIDWN